MRTGLSQHTSLRQDLRINPRLYQAMDMLYMPMMDLQQHLKQELLNNPFLDLVEPEEEDVTQGEQTPTKEEEKEKIKEENETDWEEILLNGFEVQGGAREEYEEKEYTEPVTVETQNLQDHLREQLLMLELTPRQKLLVEEFLGNIKEDGYLAATLEEIITQVNRLLEEYADRAAGRPPVRQARITSDPEEAYPEMFDEDEEEERAEEAVDRPAASSVMMIGVPEGGAKIIAGDAPTLPEPLPPGHRPGIPYFSMAEVEEMLHIMQRLDPPGVCARDLRECLLIQLEERKDTGSLTYRLVKEAFPDLIAHRWNELGRRFGTEPLKVQTAADQLARLDPKPGLKHSAGGDGYVIPDLVVEKVEGQYRVFLNDTGVPRLRLSRSYQELARDKKKFTAEHREFIASRMNSANWLIQAIEQRRQTMLKVMNFIVDRQREFFEKGIEYLKPLTLREVAEVINMHESTVSRVTNEKYVQTPRGVLPLKFFFSSALSTASGEDASARSIRAKLQKMVAEEATGNPLTDQQIVALFQEQGIKIARRTVAKYRDQLGILPARMRKRV
ncbi:MAG: RNA polymerase factor sigma-54 [Gemmatimonadetes bacterium]|nr:RNA polymerase factor sigma-54 [Gemmatimonadota bacterium]